MVEEVGMTPEESIRAATLDAATLLRRQADLGSVEQGRYADVIGVEQDPRSDIRALMRVALVIKGGRVIKDARSLE
jgi:imidazolonepropionase-like amidohydrolase